MLQALGKAARNGRQHEYDRLLHLLLGSANMIGAQRLAHEASSLVGTQPSERRVAKLARTLEQSRAAMALWAQAKGWLMTRTSFVHMVSSMR